MGNLNPACNWPQCSCKTEQNEPCKFENPDFYISREVKKAAPEPMKKQVSTIDLTPKWVGVLPMLLAAFESGTPKGRAMALDELRFMAMVADAGSLTEAQRVDLMAKRKALEAKDHGE